MKHQINIEGNNNIVLQDIYDSIININQNESSYPKNLTLPYSINLEEVIGRTEEISEIHSRFEKGIEAILLNGIGGIGKTTIALAYFSFYKDNYEHLIWISIADKFIDAFIFNQTLVRNLGLSAEVEKFINQENIVEAFKIIIGIIDKLPNALLIIDNANDEVELFQNKNILTGINPKVLITSRVNIEIFKRQTIKIQPLKLNNIKKLFYDYYDIDNDEISLNLILEQIERHTLLTELIARAGQAGSISLSKLAKFILTGELSHKDLQYKINVVSLSDTNIPIETRIIDYIKILFNTILKLSKDEKTLLLWMSLLPHVPHNKDLLLRLFNLKNNLKSKTEAIKKNFLQKVSTKLFYKVIDLFVKNIPVIDTLNLLYRKGYLNKIKATYQIHSLIAEATKQHIPITSKNTNSLVHTLSMELHFDETKDNPTKKYYLIPYGVILLDNILVPKGGLDLIKYIGLQNTLGMLFLSSGGYYEAERLFRSNLSLIKERFYIKNYILTIAAQHNLALAYKGLGIYDGAASVLNECLELSQRIYSNKDPELAKAYLKVASLCLDYREYTIGVKALEEFNSENEENSNIDISLPLKKDNDKTLDLINFVELVIKVSEEKFMMKDRTELNLAYYDYFEAKIFSEEGLTILGYSTMLALKALEIYEKKYGDEHPLTMSVYFELSKIYFELREWNTAERMLLMVLNFDLNHFGQQHPNIAFTLQLLGNLYWETGKFDKAFDFLKQSLDLNLHLYGKKHPEVAMNYELLGVYFQNINNYEKAKEYLTNALEITSDLYGSNNINTRMVLKILKVVLNQLNEN